MEADRLRVRTVVNGQHLTVEIDSRDLLIDMLRDDLGLTGTKRSCDVEVCGACTVILDGAPVSACSTLAAEADGREVTTIEGLASGAAGGLHPIQAAFVKHSALQCGFCTSGVIMSVFALASDYPGAGEEEIRSYLAGTLCRCTGYAGIVRAACQVLGARPESPS